MATADYEVLIFFSDEHSGLVTGYCGNNPVIRTPNLNRIAEKSAVFTHAYTPSPVCVPARAGFMTTCMPSESGIYGNDNGYSSGQATFMHSLGLAGYETVLCGRMHFMGLDQRHGFERRIASDITSTHWGYVYTGAPTLQKGRPYGNETDIFPVEENTAYHYDQYVVSMAKEWLSREHDKKQAIVVGTYMPHMPLGGPKDLVDYYRDKVMENFHTLDMDYPFPGPGKRPCYEELRDPEKLREIRANYYAMVEAEDELIGQVYDSYCDYLKRSGRPGIFVYVSDHGDQMGEKGYIGKRLFFEDTERIPMLIQTIGSDGKPAGVGRMIHTPVSLLDLGVTLCAMCQAPGLPNSQGRDLSAAVWPEDGQAAALEEVPVVSEYYEMNRATGEMIAGYMVLYRNFKYITYDGHEDQDLLFDLKEDPYEMVNVIARYPDRLKELKDIAKEHRTHMEWHRYNALRLQKNVRILDQWGENHPELNETWENV